MARPVGSKTRPQFYTYITEIERKEFVAWVKKNFKSDPGLAKWYGEQMFGKAPQAIELSNPDGSALFGDDNKEKAKQAISAFRGGDS